MLLGRSWADLDGKRETTGVETASGFGTCLKMPWVLVLLFSFTCCLKMPWVLVLLFSFTCCLKMLWVLVLLFSFVCLNMYFSIAMI